MFKEILYSSYPSRAKKLKAFYNYKFPLFWVIFDLLIILLLAPVYQLNSVNGILITILVSFIGLIPTLLFCVLLRISAYYDFQITKNERKYQKEFYTKNYSNIDYYKSYCRICGQELSFKLFKTSENLYIKASKIGISDYKSYYCKDCFKKYSLPQIFYTFIINLVSIIPVIIFFIFIFNKMNGIISLVGLINLFLGIMMLILSLFLAVTHYIQGLSRYN